MSISPDLYLPQRVRFDIPDLQIADYHRVEQNFISELTILVKGRLACYRFGQTRSPGVSDIDLLVVVDEDQWAHAVRAVLGLAAREQYSFYFPHPPVVVCPPLFPALFDQHSLFNLTHVFGDWQPLAALHAVPLDVGARLLRHAIWASSIRIAALKIGADEIGLRRGLMLLHNLLTSAHSGAGLLEKNISKNLSTDEIRSDILSAPDAGRTECFRKAVQQVMDYLEEVDAALDAWILDKDMAQKRRTAVVIPSRPWFLVPSSFSQRRAELSSSRWLPVHRIVPVPAYQLALVGYIARQHSTSFPGLADFKSIKQQPGLAAKFDFKTVLDRQVKSRSFFTHHGVNPNIFFPAPFSHKGRPSGWTKRVGQRLRVSRIRKALLKPRA